MYYKIHSTLNQIMDHIFDYKYNIETCKSDTLEDNKKTNYSYGPTYYRELKKLFLKYPFSKEDHIVDFGCGKGRVLIMAALNSCQFVSGIEINNKMYNIAEQNVASLKRRLKTTIIEFELINTDACDFVIDENINKFFFYDPFHLKIFMKVMNNILESLEKKIERSSFFLLT